jgi:hypothetical protein
MPPVHARTDKPLSIGYTIYCILKLWPAAPGLKPKTEREIMSTQTLPVQAQTERWRELCQQAANEENPTRVLALVQEINRILGEKEIQWKKELWL